MDVDIAPVAAVADPQPMAEDPKPAEDKEEAPAPEGENIRLFET